RMIDADISADLAQHLQAFPDSAPADFILSPYDKYVGFLYDRRNGFADPDFIAWLDSNERAKEAIRLMAKKPKPFYVLIDDAVMRADPRLGIKAQDTLLGTLHIASKINLKNRLRAAD